MTIKRFETQDGITIQPGDDIVNINGDSVLSGVPGLQGDTSYTPENEGDLSYSLGINESITLKIYQGNPSGGEANLGPGISLGQGIGDPHRSGVVAIGNDDVGYNSKAGGVYIGSKAGWNSDEGQQGANAIAIGTRAAYDFAEDNSITLNATGENLNPTGAGLFVKPVREDVENTTKAVYYNITTGEMTYAAPTGTTSDQNVWIQTFLTDTPETDRPGSVNSVEYDADGNIIALFLVYPPAGGDYYTALAKFTSTGTKLWQVRYDGSGSTDGWGIAVDSQNGFIYATARTTDPMGYDRTTVTQFSLADGSINWSKVYDFGYASTNGVIDAYNGDAVFVGFANTATGNQVTVVKIAGEDGSVYWANALDGQGYEEAYGMAIGPSGEVAVIGYMSQLGTIDGAATLYTDPVSNPNWTTGTTIVVGQDIKFTVSFVDGVPSFTNIIDRVGGRTVDGVVATVNGASIGGVTGVDDMIVKVGSIAASSEDDHMLVAKYNNDGTLAWQKAVLFDTGYNCNGADADIDSAGNIYVVGQYQKDNGQGGTDTAMNLVKFDSSGAAQWSRRVVGDCATFATSVVVGPDDYLYLSGIAGTEATGEFTCVVAKYQQNGQVAWQRLLDNVTTWSFAGAFFTNTGSGSNIAVKDGYVVIGGGFGDPGTGAFAMMAQFDTAGTMFAVDNWDYKQATFSGLLSSDASDITVTNAVKENIDIFNNITITNFSPDTDTSNFLVPTIYRQGDISTGDVTFSGVDIQGATTDNALGSINLVPSPMLKGAGQYLEIYPTNLNDAPHIHVAAGEGGDLILGTDNQHVDVNNEGHIKIRSYDSNTSIGQEWYFGPDGAITFPTLTVNLHNGGSQSGRVLQFADPDQQAIITGPAPANPGDNAQRLIIQGQNGGDGEGGDVYVWAGDADVDGGDIKIYAGNADSGSEGYGGYVNIAGGSGYNEGGHVHIDAGSSYNGDGGDVRIQAGTGAATTGKVEFNAGGRNWQFKPDGTLQFPDATEQDTAYVPLNDTFNRAWATIIGDGFNDGGTDGDTTNDIRTRVTCALPNGTVMVGGRWRNDDNAVLFQFDKNGRELWRWMAANGNDSCVTAITWDSNNNKLLVAVEGAWGWEGAGVYSTRIYKFFNEPANAGKHNFWYILGDGDKLNLRDDQQDGDVDTKFMFTKNGNLIALGQSNGENITAYSGPAVGGSNVGILNIAKEDITPYGTEYPRANIVSNYGYNWYLAYNNSVQEINADNLGLFTDVTWTTNNSGADIHIDVFVDYNNNSYKIRRWGSLGTGWADGDILTVKGSQLGGVDNGLIQGATINGFDVPSSRLDFPAPSNPTLLAALTDGRTWTINGGVLTNATVTNVVENGAIIEVTVSGNLSGMSLVDSYTFTAPGNDLTCTLIFTTDGSVSSDQFSSFQNSTGTPDTTYIRFNFAAAFGDTENHATTGYTYTLSKDVGQEAFIFNESDGWMKLLSNRYDGRYVTGLWNDTDNAYYLGGEVYQSDINPNQYAALTKVDINGNILWNKTIDDGYATVFQSITSSGSGVFAVDNVLRLFKITSAGAITLQTSLNNCYGDGASCVKYYDGYLYVAGYIYSNWHNGYELRVEKINPSNFSVVWARHIHSTTTNVNRDNWDAKIMDVNSEGVFINTYGYFGADDNYRNGAVIKLPLDNPPGAGVDYNDRNFIKFDNHWFIYSKYSSDELAYYRITDDLWSLVNRTEDKWLDGDIVYNGGESSGSAFPKFAMQFSSLDTKGISFNDNTPDLRHNPAYVPPVSADFGNNTNEYTLRLEDAGKFIRTMTSYDSNVTVYVPPESQVNFPIGTVITLINMWDYDSNGVYMYINSVSDNDSEVQFDGYDTQPRIYLAGYNGGFSYSWGLKGRGTATLMKVGRDEWLLTGNCDNTD